VEVVDEVGEVGEVFDEGWFDLVDVAGFVWVMVSVTSSMLVCCLVSS
jgi:hypothetical protein